jgi:drug/metabolite transporter (DMT)-like permease
VGSTVIAWVWWNEQVGGQVLLGSVITLAGVVAALTASQPAD